MRVRLGVALAVLVLAGCGGGSSRVLTLQQVRTAFAAHGITLSGSYGVPCSRALRSAKLCRGLSTSPDVALLVDTGSLFTSAAGSALEQVAVWRTAAEARRAPAQGTRVANVTVVYVPGRPGAVAVTAALDDLRKES